MQEKIFLEHKLKRYNNREEYLIDIKLRSFLLEFLEHKKNVPGVKHISKEIETLYILVNKFYDFYVKKSNLNLI